MPIHRKACDRSNLDNIKVVPQGYLSFAAYHYHFSDSCLWFGPSSMAVWPTFWWSIAHIWYPPWLLDDSRESHPSLIVSLQIGWSTCFWLRQGGAGQAFVNVISVWFLFLSLIYTQFDCLLWWHRGIMSLSLLGLDYFPFCVAHLDVWWSTGPREMGKVSSWSRVW